MQLDELFYASYHFSWSLWNERGAGQHKTVTLDHFTVHSCDPREEEMSGRPLRMRQKTIFTDPVLQSRIFLDRLNVAQRHFDIYLFFV